MPRSTYGTVTGCEARAYQSRQDTLSSRGRPDCQGSPACSGRCLQACEVGRNSGLSDGPTRGLLAVHAGEILEIVRTCVECNYQSTAEIAHEREDI